MRGLIWMVGGMVACGGALAGPVDPGGVGAGVAVVQLSGSGSDQGLQGWLAGFRQRAAQAGIAAPLLDAALSGLRHDPAVIRRDRNQNEFTKTIWEYLDTAVSQDRVDLGRAALRKHRALLQRIEERYGVEKEVLVAIWGLESAYGTFRGSDNTLQSLANLAYDGRRGAFFEGELLAALQILQAGEVPLARMKGSWAGAMGHTQFMPTSYLAHAQDFDGDGRRDIWSDNPADGLASAAAYLAAFGWVKGRPWGLEARLPEGFDYAQTTEAVRKPVAEWQALGVRTATGAALPDHGPASVLLPGGAGGAAFLIFANFQVIEAYNTADAYVIAVGHLADRLRGEGPLTTAWPRHLRALTLDERLELQTRLTAAGFATEGIDGRMGPRTIAAVKAFQTRQGLQPDGYPSLDVLTRLR